MSAPLVSVVMPAYNSSAFIADAIDSVLAQDYPNLELLVVDDGSTDGTAEVAGKFGSRVRVLKQRNKGPAAARNLGVAESKGEFVAFIDADDLWVPGKMSSQMAYLQAHPGVGIVYGRFERWFASDTGAFPPPPAVPEVHRGDTLVAADSGWIYPRLLMDSVVWIVSATLRRALWEELGGLNEALRVGEDYDFFIRASRLGPIDKLDQVVAIYRIHKASTTQALRAENCEYQVLKSAVQRFGISGPDGCQVSAVLLREREYRLCFNFGIMHFRGGSPWIALHAFREAFSYFKFRPKVVIYMVLSFIKTLVPGNKK